MKRQIQPDDRATKTEDPNTIFQKALAHHKANRSQKAIELYDLLLSIYPDEPELLHLKGTILGQAGKLDEGINLIQLAIKIKSDSVDYHNNLGLLLFQSGRLKPAKDAFLHAINIAPTHLPAYSNLANVFEASGQMKEAWETYNTAIKQAPENVILMQRRGFLLQKIGKLEEASKDFRRALELQPRSAEALNNLGNVLTALGQFEEAELTFKKAIRLRSDYGNAHYNLGSLLVRWRRMEEAVVRLQKAISCEADHALAFSNLAAAFNFLGQHEEAETAARQALVLAPNIPEAHNNLGVALRALGNYIGAEASYRKVVELDPTHATGHSNLIYVLDFNSNYNLRDHQAERHRWQKSHGQPLSSEILSHRNDPNPDRKLRVGYVSADFRQHSATNAFSPMIQYFDRDRFEVICYASNMVEDKITKLFRASANKWQICSRMDHHQVATLIREDCVDILVDLSGHSAENRLLAFARKPAPVQISAWGFATGTGLKVMDYFLTDQIVVPKSETKLFSETVLYLPCHMPYNPPSPSPAVTAAPCEENKFVTFGCYSRLEKISDDALSVWAKIFQKQKNCKLIVKSPALSHPSTISNFEKRIFDAGIDLARVELLGGDPQQIHLEKHGLIDVMLDPFPHAGGVSTADSLWMGVPVISLLGNTIAGRIGASALHALGLDEFIAADRDAYVDIAIRAIKELGAISIIRRTLRERMLRSPMGDLNGYVNAVENLYRSVWVGWCQSKRD